MWKNKYIALILLISISFSLVSCSEELDTSNDENIITQDSLHNTNDNTKENQDNDNDFGGDKINWAAISSLDTNYVKLEDINPENVLEIELGFPLSKDYQYLLEKTFSGFICTATTTRTPEPNSLIQSEAHIIRKIDNHGDIVWQKEYEYTTFPGRINNLIVCDDGSFLFSIQGSNWSNDAYSRDKSYIVKCDENGNEIWTCELDDYSGELLLNIFLTENEEIIAAGNWYSRDGKQTVEREADDIVITKVNKDGNVIEQKSFGGRDFDSVRIAKYRQGVGIIINGYTQSHNGEFAIVGKETSKNFIALVDENLKVKWVTHADDNVNFVYDQLVVSGDFVYVLGNKYHIDNKYITSSLLTINSGFFLKLDLNGNQVLTLSRPYEDRWSDIINILDSGDLIIGSGQQNQGELLILDSKGNVKKHLKDLKYRADEIIPTNDGGFIVKAIRDIKTIPQPPQISCIWYDREVVITKYDKNYQLQWRKTYDNYKDSTQIDLVLPLRNGNVIIENYGHTAN